ncbi:hypothetical protein K438DRAFT_2110485 [Mycena galopus ATCC 62051]|nr:hypothetical protein K438DRAFT_2110485 [Mycena galopus ATCC 62051]
MVLNINDPVHHCPKCRNKMGLQYSGRYRRYFVVVRRNSLSSRRLSISSFQCFNAAHAYFNYFFPIGVSPIMPAPTMATVITSKPSSKILSALSAPRHKAKKTACKEYRCKIASHRFCTSQKCPEHCLLHQIEKPDAECRIHVPAPQPIPPAPALSPTSLRTLDSIQQYHAPMVAERQQAIWQQAQHAQAHALTLKMPLPPSPTSSQEETDRIFAMWLAFGSLLPPSSPQPLAGSSRAHALSLHATPHQPAASSSRINFSSPPSLPSSTMPLPPTIRASHMLTVYFWPVHHTRAIVSAVQDCPEWRHPWPQIRLADILHLLATPSSPPANFYDCYFPGARAWMSVSVQDTQTVASNQVLLVRCSGATGRDQIEAVQRLFPAPLSSPPKRHRSSLPEVIEIYDTDSEDESPQKIKLEPQTPPRKPEPKCARLSSLGSPSVVTSKSHYTSASSSTLTSRSTTPSLSRSHSTTSMSSLPSLPSRGSSPFFPVSITLPPK